MSKKWLENSLLYKLFFSEIWQLHIIPSKLLTNNSKTLNIKKSQILKSICSNKTHSFFADPFGIYLNHHYYIFFEYLDYRNKKGKIHYNKYDKNFNLIESKLALTKPYHLSYPYIFQHGQQIALLPEITGSKVKQHIFIANNFPTKWQEYKINIPSLVDPSIFIYNNKYIILGSLNNKKTAFISDKLLGQYKEIKYISNYPHHQSGGVIYRNNDKFYRPLQVSSKTYGEKILMIELEVNSNFIKEKIKNSYYIHCSEQKGLHTISYIDNQFTIIDTKYFYFSLCKFIASLQKSWHKRQRKKLNYL
jgi:hypothetical protein